MTNSPGWTPAEIAVFDQAMADANRDLDGVITVLHGQITKVGEPQALADMALVLRRNPSQKRDLDLLIAALRRLAAQDRHRGPANSANWHGRELRQGLTAKIA